MEEKTYAVFTADSINTMAEASGMSPVPHDAATTLGEDASYRVRQAVMLATQYMKHSKRRRMTVDDFNKAAKELSLMPVCGHGSQEPVSFRQVKDLNMHCVDDPEVNLCDIALGNSIPKNIGLPSIKAHWLAVEGTIKIWSGGSSASQGKSHKEMSPTHLNYYSCMTKALLGQKAEAKKRALQDLRTNPNIVQILPYIVNFVISGIKNMSHDMGSLTTMLNAIRALLHNRSLYLLHKPYLTTIVQGVEFCVLEPLAASISSSNDQWVLRDFAARLLAEIINRWSSPQNHLRYNTVKCLRETLHDTTKPFYSHYGAVMALIALGHNAVEEVILPHLPTYWPHLKAALENMSREQIITRCDAQKVHGALRLAAEKFLRKHIRKFQDEIKGQKEEREVLEMFDAHQMKNDKQPNSVPGDSESKKPEKNIQDLYKELYEYFGDSIANCLPLVETHEIFQAVKKDDMVSLGDANSGKSGEELLDNLMEQIYLEEKLEQERKERERIEKEERDRQERLRLARELLLQKQREEEERLKRLKMEEEERLKRLKMEEEERLKRLKMEEERLKKLKIEEEERLKRLKMEEERLKRLKMEEERLKRLQMEEEERLKRLKIEEEERLKRLKMEEEERLKRLKIEEEEQKRRRLELEEAEHQKRLEEKKRKHQEEERMHDEKKRRRQEEERRHEEEEKRHEEEERRQEDEERRQEEERHRDLEEQIKELNKNRSKPRWKQEIELRRIQLEEEAQYSRKMEAKKRQESRFKAEEEARIKRQKEEREQAEREEEKEEGSRSLRRRKPINYTEKDEDISDLFVEERAVGARRIDALRIDAPRIDAPRVDAPRLIPRLNPAMPPHSDISDYSDEEAKKVSKSPSEGIAVSKVIDPSKGLLKLKIKRQTTHSSTPPHPMSATPHHTSSSYHSPSMQSPLYSPVSGTHSTPPPPPIGSGQYRSKSSSGSEKESKNKKSASASRPRLSSSGFQDISDPDEPIYDKPFGSIPPQLYSPGPESSGSDLDPHRKSLKLKLKLTPKESASEGDC